MSTYREVVDQLFRTHSHYVIANSSAEHASVLYETFFNYAQNEVRIFCHKLNPEVFACPNVCDAVEKFLDRKGSLYIAVQEEPQESSKFLEIILNEKYEQQVFLWLGKKFQGKDGKLLNFAVMDSVAYRFEPDQDETQAIASANDPSFARKLVQAFQNQISAEALETAATA